MLFTRTDTPLSNRHQIVQIWYVFRILRCVYYFVINVISVQTIIGNSAGAAFATRFNTDYIVGNNYEALSIRHSSCHIIIERINNDDFF